MSNFAYQPISKPDAVESQRGNNKAIEKFITELHTTKLSESSISAYKRNVEYIMSGIYIPIMSVTNSLISERVAECYRESSWADSTVRKVVGIINRFFTWCKNNMYTSITIDVINPVTGKPQNSQIVTTDIKLAKESSNLVVTTPVTEKINKPIKKMPIISAYEENLTKVSNVKTLAVLAVLRRTNLTEQEISELNIMDFMYDRLVYQGHGNKSFMRIVPIDITTRNAIYDYLKTRNDNVEALFLSDRSVCERITSAEIRAMNVT